MLNSDISLKPFIPTLRLFRSSIPNQDYSGPPFLNQEYSSPQFLHQKYFKPSIPTPSHQFLQLLLSRSLSTRLHFLPSLLPPKKFSRKQRFPLIYPWIQCPVYQVKCPRLNRYNKCFLKNKWNWVPLAEWDVGRQALKHILISGLK